MSSFWVNFAAAVISKLSKEILKKAIKKSEHSEERMFKLDLVIGNKYETYFLDETDDRKAIEWARCIIHKHREAINFHSLYELIDSKRKIYREILFEASGVKMIRLLFTVLVFVVFIPIV